MRNLTHNDRNQDIFPLESGQFFPISENSSLSHLFPSSYAFLFIRETNTTAKTNSFNGNVNPFAHLTLKKILYQ